MYGFLNVLLAAALMRAGLRRRRPRSTLLDERDPSAIRRRRRPHRVARASASTPKPLRPARHDAVGVRLLLVPRAGGRPATAGAAVTPALDRTHDAALRCWVESANAPGTDFPIQNLPFGVFRGARQRQAAARGRGHRRQVLDVARAGQRSAWSAGDALRGGACLRRRRAERADGARAAAGAARCGCALSDAAARRAADAAPSVRLALVPIGRRRALRARARRRLHRLLRVDLPRHQRRLDVPPRQARCCRTTSTCRSATTAGRRRSWPAARAVRRPVGPDRDDRDAAAPRFGPSRRLDYELEVGVFIGAGNALGDADPGGRRRGAHLRPRASSTTGRRATSRRGSTSRSARSWPRTSPPPSRPGW